LARILSKRDPRTVKAIVEVKCSEALVGELKRMGAEVVMYRTGHSLIKAKMRELKSPFAGEMSGHSFLLMSTTAMMTLFTLLCDFLGLSKNLERNFLN